MWSLLALFAMPVVTMEAGEPAPPGWALEAWADDIERLMGRVDLGEDGVELTLSWQAGLPDRLDVAGEAEQAEIHITLEGEGWQHDTEKARRVLRQNLAHEISHVPQLRRLDTAFEPLILHEGYAEAQSLELLIRAKLWTAADARRARLGFEQRCLGALREGPLLPQIEAGERDAVYACGAVLVLAAADTARTTPESLHRSYAEAAINPAGLGPWAKAALGEDFTRSALRFVTTDFSGGPTAAIEGLRAGRL